MPTLSSITNSLQAVLAHSQVMEVIQHNVSNASTPGYRRQEAVLTAAVPSSIGGTEFVNGAGQRGGSVFVSKVERFNLAFFDGRFRTISAETKNWEMQSQILTQLEATLAETSEDGLLPKLDQFWKGWQELSSDPTNTSLRAVLLDDASSLANAFNRRASQILQLRNDQNLSVSSQVDEINMLASEVARLNGEISHVLSIGEQPNDLMDKRDVALDKLAELTGAVSSEQKNGEMVVSIGGHVLVVGHDNFKLETRANAENLYDVYWSQDNQQLVPPSGSLKGTMEARDNILVDQMDGLNTLATSLAAQVNAIHSTGYGLTDTVLWAPPGTPGRNFFTGTSAMNIAVNQNLIDDPSKIAAADNINQPGNNAIALKMVDLKNFKGMSGGTATLNEFYNMQITQLAVDTKRAGDNTYQHDLVAKALSDQRESVAGVNLDEEAANMAKTQKAYQAAARMLTTMDELLDIVINRMGLAGR